MANGIYDIITVGGGLGGAAQAKAMAEQGARVLVLERETQFKDRARGENCVSWGGAEMQALGLSELLRTTCAHETPQFAFSIGPEFGEPRDLIATTPQRLPFLPFTIRRCKR
jgi:choline dehydrogenase-like flavoprotein